MHPHDHHATARESRNAFRRELIARGVPTSLLRMYEAHARYLMFTFDQIIASQAGVISDLKAENAALQGKMGPDTDEIAQQAAAEPLTAAKLAELYPSTPTPSPTPVEVPPTGVGGTSPDTAPVVVDAALPVTVDPATGLPVGMAIDPATGLPTPTGVTAAV